MLQGEGGQEMAEQDGGGHEGLQEGTAPEALPVPLPAPDVLEAVALQKVRQESTGTAWPCVVRYLVGRFPIAPGDVRVVQKMVGPQPGRIHVDRVRMVSVFSLWMDVLAEDVNVHLILHGVIRSGSGVAPGLYRDEDRRRVSWLLTEGVVGLPAQPPYAYDAQGGAVASWVQRLRIPLVAAICSNVSVLNSYAQMNLRTGGGEVVIVGRHDSGIGSNGSALPGETYLRVDGARGVEAASVVTAATMNHHHVFLTRIQREWFDRLFWKDQLSAGLRMRLHERSVTIPNGIDFEMLDEVIGCRPGEPLPAVYGVGSFYRWTEAWKQCDPVIRMMYNLIVSEMITTAVVTLPERDDLKGHMGWDALPPGFEYHPGCGRIDYLRKAAQTVCAVWNSREESSPTAPIECAMVGCVPIFPARPWVEALYGNWPLVYKNMDEAAAMVLSVIENRHQWRIRAMEWSRKHYGSRTLGVEWHRHLRRWVVDQHPCLEMRPEELLRMVEASGYRKRLVDWMSDHGTVTWAELLRHQHPPVLRGTGQPVIKHHEVPLLLQRMGWVDDVESPLPTFSPRG